jgi:hypothetical protein
MGGGYITTCWTQQAWNLQMIGGDDWTAWLNGTYTPAPTPTPTVTVTATPEPIIQERIVERVVSGGERTIIKEVPTPCKMEVNKTKKKKPVKKKNPGSVLKKS